MSCRTGICSLLLILILARMSSGFPEDGYDISPPKALGYAYETPDVSPSGLDSTNSKSLLGRDKSFSLAETIPGGGIPSRDYPVLASVPKTGFSCKNQIFPGYYADTSGVARCQVFHICQLDGRQDSFLCPNGTVFNQQYFVCDWWFNVDCAASVIYTVLNADIGKVPASKGSSSTGNSLGGDSSGAKPTSESTDNSKETSSSTSYNYQGPEGPNQLYDIPEVSQPSGLYSLPAEK